VAEKKQQHEKISLWGKSFWTDFRELHSRVFQENLPIAIATICIVIIVGLACYAVPRAWEALKSSPPPNEPPKAKVESKTEPKIEPKVEPNPAPPSSQAQKREKVVEGPGITSAPWQHSLRDDATDIPTPLGSGLAPGTSAIPILDQSLNREESFRHDEVNMAAQRLKAMESERNLMKAGLIPPQVDIQPQGGCRGEICMVIIGGANYAGPGLIEVHGTVHSFVQESVSIWVADSSGTMNTDLRNEHIDQQLRIAGGDYDFDQAGKNVHIVYQGEKSFTARFKYGVPDDVDSVDLDLWFYWGTHTDHYQWKHVKVYLHGR